MGKGSGEATASTSPFAALTAGTALTAQFSDGNWYKASVVHVRKKAPQVKVNFDGYPPETDAWLGLDQLRSKLLKGDSAPAKMEKPAANKDWDLPEAGARCQVDVGDGKFHAAEVLATSSS